MHVHWAGTGGGDESATGSLPAGVSPGVSEGSREGHGKTGEGPWGRPVPPAQPVYAPGGASGSRGPIGSLCYVPSPLIFGESSPWIGDTGVTGEALCSGVSQP